jgi:hypothetical protein
MVLKAIGPGDYSMRGICDNPEEKDAREPEDVIPAPKHPKPE